MPIPFRPLARMLTSTLHPAPQVDGAALQAFLSKSQTENDTRGVLITANHYSARDLRAWWLAIIISAIYPDEVHWVVTSGWTNSGWLTGFTHWLFPRGASILGFTSMPAMPPDPKETEQRAAAVRQVLRYARGTSHPVIGIAPEGGDTPGGVLGDLPPGAGRFMHLLSMYCPHIIPVGIWSDYGTAWVRFGDPYHLDVPEGQSAHQFDQLAGDLVMKKIALSLPEHLRGKYA